MTKFITGIKIQELKNKFAPRRLLLRFQLNHKSYGVMMLALIAVCGILYLSQVNTMATKGYKINDLEKQSQQLEAVNKKLMVQVTQLRSMESLESRLAKIEMVPVGRVDYIKANNGVVAVNR